MKRLINYIFFLGVISILFPVSLSAQDISFDTFQGVAVPSPSIPDVCPTTSYSFSAVLTNNTGAQLDTSSATIRITVSGANSGTYIIDAPGGNIANTKSFAVTQTINMIKPGSNSFAVEVYLDNDPSTIIDSDYASIEVTANPVSNNLLTPGFSQTPRRQIVDIELGTVGAQTGTLTQTFTVTLSGVDFTTTVASGTVSSVAQVATAIAADINGNAAYSASNIGDPESINVNVIRITAAVSGTAFNISSTESSTMSFGSPRVIAGSQYIDVCSNESVTFNSSGGIGSNGYNFYVNNASATGQQTSQSYVRGSPSDGDVIYAKVTNGSGCIEQTFPITINVTETPDDSGSPIAITGTGFTQYNDNQSFTVTVSGTVEAGDMYSITTTGTTYTSSNVRTTTASVTEDLATAMAGNGLTVSNGPATGTSSSLIVTIPLAGTPFSLSTSSVDSNSSASIGFQMTAGSKAISICENDSQVITAQNATSYKIYVGGSLVSTSSTTTISSPVDGTIIRVEGYTGAGGSGCSSDLYITVDLNNITPGSITASQTVCHNTAPTNLTGNVATLSAGASLTYRWDISTDGDSWSSLGITTQNYQPPALTQSTYYRRVAIGNLQGQICEETSNSVFIKVEPVEGISLASDIGLTGQNICAGASIQPIIYNLTGSASSVLPSATASMGLPDGLQIQHDTQAQVNTVNIENNGEGSYKLFINSRPYVYNASSGATSTTIRNGLIALINNDSEAVVTASSSGSTGLNITADEPWQAFSAVTLGGTPGSSNMATANVTSNINQIRIFGQVSADVSAGSYSYTVSTTGAAVCSTNDTETGTITIPEGTATLTSAAGTASQDVCVNTAITPITYSISGATGASVVTATSLLVDGLPAGVTGSFAGGTLTITGTPTVSLGTDTEFTYTVVTSGNAGGCSEGTVSGTITVAPAQLITLVSDNSTTAQEVCDTSVPITDIVYDITGATTISPTLSPLANTITVNPTVVKQVNTIQVSGAATGTHSIAVNGEIFTVGDDNSLTAAQIRNALFNAINASATLPVTAKNTSPAVSTAFYLEADAAGVPFGVNLGGYSVANLSNTSTTSNTNRITIEGTWDSAVAAQQLTYTLTTYNGTSPTCTATSSLSGTITRKASSTIALTSAAATANQTVCNNTAIVSITYTYADGGTGAQVAAPTFFVDGLPSGLNVKHTAASKTFVIDGIPNVTVPYTTVFNYSVSTTGSSGCDEPVITGTVTVEPPEVITLTSSNSLTNQNVCAGSAIATITYELSGSAIQLSPNTWDGWGFPSGINASQDKSPQVNTITVTGAATGTYTIAVNGSLYSYTYVTGNSTSTIRDGLKAAINGSATASVTAADSGPGGLSLTADTAGTPFGINLGGTAGISNLTNTSTTSNTNEIILAGTIDSDATPGSYSYTVSTTGAAVCSTNDTETGTITIPEGTATLTSAAGTASQDVCVNTAITPITYSISGATGASVVTATSLLVDGLPAGVTGSFAGGTLTITGTPTVSLGTDTEFTYTVVTSGNAGGCSEGTVSGTITVAPAQLITLVSDNSTTAQEVCDTSVPITDIVYDITGATTISPTLSPLANTITVNPTVVKQVNTIQVSGAATGTHSIAVNGEIFTVGDDNSLTAAQIRNALFNAINASATLPVTAKNTSPAVSTAFYLEADAAGVPFGVNLGGYSVANLSNTSTTSNTNRITIEGTWDSAVAAQQLTYTLTTYNGTSPTCTATSSLSGTITRKASSTIALTSAAATANQTVCNNTAIVSITYTYADGGTGAQVAAPTFFVDGLPSGLNVKHTAASKTFVIDGIPNVTVPYTTVFNYSVSTTGSSGCDEPVITGTVTVEPPEVITLTSSNSLTNQNVCAGSAIATITYELSGSAIQLSPNTWDGWGFPSGINASQDKSPQVNTITVTGAATGTYTIAVNGSLYSYTYVTGNSTSTIRDGLKAAINGSATASVTAADSGPGGLSLTADTAGTPFGINLGGTAGISNLTNTSTTSNTNQISIAGTVALGVASNTYSYTISTTGAYTCTGFDSETGNIIVNGTSTVTLSSAASTGNQTVCNNTAIATITYAVTGAVSASVDDPTAAVIDGLPNGVSPSFLGGVLTITGIPNTTDLVSTEYTYTVRTLGNYGGCDEATITGKITVDPLQGGIVNSGNDQVFCQDPSNAGVVPNALSVTGSTAPGVGVEYQWQSSTDSVTWNDIVGATSQGYNVPSISQTTYYRRLTQRVSLGVVQCQTPSNAHKITVHSIDVGQIAMPTQICFNTVPDPLVSVKDATSNGTVNYQWQISSDNNVWTDITGATGNDYTPPAPLTSTTYYRRQAISLLNDQLNTVTIAGSPSGGDVFTIVINGIATSVTTGTSTGTYANILIDHINATASIPVAASQTVSGVIDFVHNTPGTNFSLTTATNSSGGTIGTSDSSQISCSRESSSIMIQVVDEVKRANTLVDQTICTGTQPNPINSTGFSPTAPAPNIGAITYAWYGSTDNENFTALNAGYTATTTTQLTPASNLTQTTYYKMRTTNTFNIFPVERITVTGDGAAVDETYTIKVGTGLATFTTVVTVTANAKITEGIANAINTTAPLNTVIEAYDYQNGKIDIRGKVAGTGITVEKSTGGSANATISNPVTIKSTSSTCSVDSDITTVIVSPNEDIEHLTGPLDQTVCAGDPITPVKFKASGGAADLMITPNVYFDPTDNGDNEYTQVAAGLDDTVDPRLGNDSFNYYSNQAASGHQGIAVVRTNGVYEFSGTPTSNGTISFDIFTESYQKDRINITSAPNIGEKYNLVINSFTVSVTATAATVSSLVTLLTDAVNADPRINSATQGVYATGDTAAGTVVIAGVHEEREHTIGFKHELAQGIGTIALTGTTNSAGEEYSIIVNGVPYNKTYGTGIAAATIATEFSALINASSVVSSTVAGGTITIEVEKRGIPLVLSTVTGGTTPQIGFTSTSTQSATTNIGAVMTITPIRCADCLDPTLDGSITRSAPVTTPSYIIANYATGASGNSQMTQETIIDADGSVRIYNGASCDTPEVISFESCGGNNISGYQWTLTSSTGAPGSIDSSTGAVTWNPDFSGIATISVAALGCAGPSGTQSANFEIFPADPIEEHIYMSAANLAVTDVVTVTVDGTSAGYTVTGAPLTQASTLASITTLINTNFSGDPFNVTATVFAGPYVQVITDDSSSPAFELSVTVSSSLTSITAVTINSVSTTLQTPATPSAPDVLDKYEKSGISVTLNATSTTVVPAGEVYKLTINGRCYDYTTSFQDTADAIKNSFLSQINAATHVFSNQGTGDAAGVTASNRGNGGTYSSLWVTADYLGYSDYGTSLSFAFERIPVPNDENSPAYNLNSWLQDDLSKWICGPITGRTGALPNCEITAATPNTQFFAESENYQYITWSLTAINPGIGSALTVGDNQTDVTFTQRGIIDWTEGFHGSFNLNATAMGCDGVTTSPVSTKSIVIKSKAVTPTTVILQAGSFMPQCPGDVASTQFYSDPGAGNSVTWSIDNNSAGVIDCDTGVLTWDPEFSGNVNITATSTGCGATSVTTPFNVAPGGSLLKTSGAGTEFQAVCVNTRVATVTYDILGASTSAAITSGSFPSGITGQPSPTIMTYIVTVSGGGNTAVGESFKIYINGKEYNYVAAGTVNKDVAAKNIANLINADGLRIVNADADTASGTIRISEQDPSQYFTINLNENSANLDMTTPIDPHQGIGVFVISGAPTQAVLTPTRYDYTISTTGGGTCNPGTVQGYIIVNPDSNLLLTSAAGTDSQDICVGEDIVDLTVEVFNGATGATIDPLVGLTGLPPNVNHAFTPLQQIDDISFSGANSGSSTETYSISLSVNGGATHTASYSAPPNSTVATVRTGVTSAINQYVKLITIAGQGTADTDAYTVTVTTDTARGATFTATQTISSKEAIATGVVSAINGTAPLNTVVEAEDMGNGSFKLYGKVIGTNIDNITSNVSGTGSISAPVTLDLTANLSATETASGTIRVTATNLGLPQSVITAAEPTLDMTVTAIQGTGVITISGTPSVTLNNAVVYNFTVRSTGNIFSCAEDTYSASILLRPRETITHPTSIVSTTFATGSTTNGLLNQQVCDGSELVGIRLDLSGSAIGASSAALNQFTGLPPGVNLTPNTTAQVNTTQVTGTMSAGDSFTANINGVEYVYSTTNTETAANVTLGISNAINSATDEQASPVTAAASGTILTLTADVPGISFTYTATSTNADAATNSSTLDTSVSGDIANINYVTITGDPNPVSTTTAYHYTIETTGTSCTPHATVTGTIRVLAPPSIATATASGTDAQQVCEDTPITNVSFKIFGGAVSMTTQENGGFNQLPPGLTKSYTDTKQIEEITFTGAATAPATETYGIQINSNDTNYSGTYSTTTIIGENIITFIDRIVNQINADFPLEVTASSKSGNVLVLTSDAVGPYKGFSFNPYSLSATPSYTLTSENTQGTGLYTISGSPDLSGINPPVDAPMTYTYTVQTSGNIYTSCSVSSTTQSATITVIPAEQLNYSATITTTLFTGDTVSTTTNGELTQAICQGGDIDGIRIEVGGSATGATVAPLVGQNGIPPGVTMNSFKTAQVQTAKVSGTATQGETYEIIINGINYLYTVTGAGITNTVVAEKLVEQINNGTGIRLSPVTASSTTDVITLSADQPGRSFVFASQTSTNTAEIDGSIAGDVANVNYITITGSPSDSVSSTKTYTFDVTSVGTSCTPPASRTVAISILPNSKVTLTSAAGTANQEVCNEDDILDITYEISNGAKGYVIESAAFAQQDRIDITGTYAANDKVTVSINELKYVHVVQPGLTNIDNIINDLTPKLDSNSNIEAIPDLTNDAIYLKAAIDGGTYLLELSTTTGTITNTNITPSSSSSLPTGVGHSIANLQQEDVVTLAGNAWAVGDIVTIYVTGGVPVTTATYSHTVVGGAQTATLVRDALIAKIEADLTRIVNVSAGPSGSQLTLQGKVSGEAFGVSQFTNTTEVNHTITSANTVGSARITISGKPNSGSLFTTSYFYRIRTTNNLLGCGDDVLQGSIKVSPKEKIVYDPTDSNFPGSDNAQQVCLGTEIQGIRFNLTGTAEGATVPALVGTTGLPPGVIKNQVRTKQVNVINITASTAIAAQYIVIIDGVSYVYTTSDPNGDGNVDQDASTIAVGLASEINTASGVRESNVTATSSGTSIQLSADVTGTPFNLSFSAAGTISGGGAITLDASATVANENYITITGTPSLTAAITSSVAYSFTLTTSGTNCLPHDTADGTITLIPGSTLVLTSALSTNEQVRCTGNDIDPITFTIGGGATGLEVVPSSNTLALLPEGINLGVGGSPNTWQIIGKPTASVSQTTTYQFTLRTTGNPSCEEATFIGQITIAPPVVIDSDGIAALVQDITCSTANGFSPDGQIGDPVLNPLNSFISGGIEDTAQIDRVSIIGETTNAEHGLGDTYTISINGTESYSVTTNDISPNDGNPDQSKSDIASALASQITGGSGFVTATSNVGGAGTIDIKAKVPGIAFTSTVTHVTDNVIRMTLGGAPAVTDVVTITVGGASYAHTVVGGNNLISIVSSLTTLIGASTTVTATDNGNGTADIRTLNVGGLVNFSGTVSSSAMTVSSEDRSTEFTKSPLIPNFVSNYVYSWTAANDLTYNNNNLEIVDLPADSYTLTVSIDGLAGCAATAGPFTVTEPTIVIGTVSETCGGTVNIPISGNFTTDQMSGTGNILTVNLYEGTAGSSPSFSLFKTETYPVGSFTATFTTDPQFTGLTPGLNYRVEVLTNTCAIPEASNFGPISAVLEIDESLIVITDQICAGETDGTITVPLNSISGGSGTFDYQWTCLSCASNPTYNVKDLNGVAPGTYQLTITDSVLANCTVTTTGPIEVEGTTSLITITPSAQNILTNTCVAGTEGSIEINVAGVDSAWVEWEYLVKTTLGVSSGTSSSTSNTLTPNRRDLLPANFVSEESNPTGGITSFENLPAGIYRVKVYSTNPGVNPCADVSQDFEITEPSPIEFTSAGIVVVNPADAVNPCPADATSPLVGSIAFQVTGGQPPYFYTIIGGDPTEPFDGTFYRDDLPAGSYDIVVTDSSGCLDGTNNLSAAQTIVLTDPLGDRLVLTEGTVTPIPCGNGTGQFIVQTQGGYFSGLATETNFTVRVVSADGNFITNSTINPGQDITVSNVPNPGSYTVTVDDGLCETSITIDMTISAPNDLAAQAIIEGVQDCSSSAVSANGPTIKLDGPISGGLAPYEIKWEQRTELNLDTFTIAFTGNVSPSDTGTLGVSINGTSYTSSITVDSTTGILNIASDLANVINNDPSLDAYLVGSSIVVRSLMIDTAQSLTPVGTVYGLSMSLSPISITSQSVWNEVPNTAGYEVLTDLSVGFYRGVITDQSGCGSTLIGNVTQGGYVFEIDDPSQLQIQEIEFDPITCTQNSASIRFKLGNGQYDLVPDATVFEFTLNGTVLQSTGGGNSGAGVVGNFYTPNFATNEVLIQNLAPDSYSLEVKNIQTTCLVLYTFTIDDLIPINYSGQTNFNIDSCHDSYQDPFFDQYLITGGTPYLDTAGQPYYSLIWTYYPDPNSAANSSSFNSLSNNINFLPLPGLYQLTITDKNGCTILDLAGNPETIEFTFESEFSDIEVAGNVDATGAFSSPVSCQLDAQDGAISISVNSSNGSAVPPYDITWEVQGAPLNDSQAILLFQGVAADVDSLEVYSVLINNQPFTYTTQTPNESIESVVQEFAQVIENSTQYSAVVESAPNGGVTPQDVQIRISSLSGAAITLEIVSQATRLQMLNSSVSSANWTPLDGSSGSPNFTGYITLNNLAEGNYRYTIVPAGQSNCSGPNVSQNSIQGVITVVNENTLQIREGPVVDPELCRGQPGTIYIDVFDGQTGPLSFFYGASGIGTGDLIVYDQVGENQYLLYIDNPVESGRLEILNDAGCGIAREINIGIGDPMLYFDSVSNQQTQQFIAREDITFYDQSEGQYNSFEFIFGDGTQTERLERNQPEPITHEYAISGTYYVTLRIYNDLYCVAEKTETIKIGKGYNVLSPNVFTPNGDIYNQCFKPLFNGLVEVTFRVYDAQGALLYEEIGDPPVDPTKEALTINGWCGPVQQEEDKEIITPYFIYTLEGKTVDGVEVFRDGTFILLR